VTRTRKLLAALALVAVAAAGGCSTGSSDDATPAPPDFSRPPAGVATRTGPFDSGPVRPPASGVWAGAWVKPDVWGQSGRRESVGDFEKELGRRLDVVNTYRTFEEPFWTATDKEYVRRGSTVMVSWASGDTRSILDGQHDALIREQAGRVKAAKRPVMMRFRWEMDRPNLRATMWSPQDFIAAWKYVRKIFTAEGATNASWVWCPTAEGFDRGEAPAFYPGDDQVDWTCVDVYASSSLEPLDKLMGAFLTFAAQHPKPIIVGEFGVSRAWSSAQRAAWLQNAAQVVKANPQIRAVSYFESDPEDNPQTLLFAVSDDPKALGALRSVYRDPYFNPSASG
jgi:hypothetical protein